MRNKLSSGAMNHEPPRVFLSGRISGSHRDGFPHAEQVPLGALPTWTMRRRPPPIHRRRFAYAQHLAELARNSDHLERPPQVPRNGAISPGSRRQDQQIRIL